MGALGLVQAGDGGSAGAYQFDSDGLSVDSRLAYYLQSLTPQQLQNSLDGKSPTADLIAINNDLTGGAGLPCGTAESGDPNCTGGAPLSAFGLGGIFGSVPTWVWLAGGGTLAALLLIPRGGR
jgi:hypothetical protein